MYSLAEFPSIAFGLWVLFFAAFVWMLARIVARAVDWFDQTDGY